MRYLYFFMIFCIGENVLANDCHKSFNEKELINSVSIGKAILYPFNFSFLVDGKIEPELKSQHLNILSQNKIIKLSSRIHSESKLRGTERIKKYTNEAEITIIYRGTNNGFYVSSYYKKLNGCWFMAGLSDESI